MLDKKTPKKTEKEKFLLCIHEAALDVRCDGIKHGGRQGKVEEAVSGGAALLQLLYLAVQVDKRTLFCVGALHVAVNGPELIQLLLFFLLRLKRKTKTKVVTPSFSYNYVTNKTNKNSL